MAPVWDEILGCHILVSNFILGGLYGYYGGNWISIWYTPPWYTVSSGPLIYPFQCRKSPSRMLTLIFDFSDYIDLIFTVLWKSSNSFLMRRSFFMREIQKYYTKNSGL